MIERINRFAWVNDLAGYFARLRNIASGTVPILKPDSPERCVRWLDVLSWYGIREVVDNGDAEFVSELVHARPCADQRPLTCAPYVLALDHHVQPIAEAYALVTGRTCRSPEKMPELLGDAERQPEQPVVVIATAATLTLRVLKLLEESFGSSWSILCGRDAAALSFLIAKQLISAKHSVDYPSIAVDVLSQTVVRHECCVTTPRLYTSATTRSVVAENWLNLSLLAHGEGSHLSLNEVVCCGTTSDAERDLSGSIIAGCDRTGGRRYCKRAHDPSQEVVRFGDLRAQFVALFSCIGFSATGQVYPSDSSLILDAIEGYPTAVTTADRIFRMIPSIPFLWFALRTRGRSMAEILELLNDIQFRQEKCTPYLLIGDAWMEQGTESKNAEGTSEAPFTIRIIPTTAKENCVLRLSTQSTSDMIVTGETVAVLVSTADGPSPIPVLTDKADFDAIRVQLEHHAKALLVSSSIERSLRLAARAADSREGFSGRLEDLALVRNDVEGAIDRAMCYWHQARTCGVWTDELDACVMSVGKTVSAWDCCMADIAEQFLLDRYIEDLCGLGRRVVSVKTGAPCERCHNITRVECRVPAYNRTQSLNRIDCPLCGCLEMFFEGNIRLAATPPASLISGINTPFKARTLGRGRGIPSRPSMGHLLTRVTDRGTGKQVFAAAQPINKTATVKLIIPDELTSELHIVKCLVIRALSLAYLRFRVPGEASTPGIHDVSGTAQSCTSSKGIHLSDT